MCIFCDLLIINLELYYHLFNTSKKIFLCQADKISNFDFYEMKRMISLLKVWKVLFTSWPKSNQNLAKSNRLFLIFFTVVCNFQGYENTRYLR